MNKIDDCAICLTPLKKKIIISCNHSFHFTCLFEYYNKYGRDITCPLCRTPFNLFLDTLKSKNVSSNILKKIFFSEEYDNTFSLWKELLNKKKSFQIKKYITNGADLESKNIYGENLILWAIKNKCSLHVIKILLLYMPFNSVYLDYAIKNNLDINTIDYLAYRSKSADLDNSLLTYIQYGSLEEESSSKIIQILDIFLKNGVNINKCDIYKNSLLHISLIKDYNIEIIQYLLDKNIDIKIKNIFGYDALSTGVMNNSDKDIIKLIVQNDIAHPYSYDHSPSPLLLNTFLEPPHKLEDTVAPVSNFIFCLNYYKDDYDMIKFFIDSGANVSLEMENGNSPLIMALVYGANIKIIELLVDEGADINKQNIIGSSPLIVAVKNNSSVSVIDLLLDNGADINIKNNDGETASDISNKKKLKN